MRLLYMVKQISLDGWQIQQLVDLLKKGSDIVAKTNRPIVLYRQTLEEEDEAYLQKLDKDMSRDFIVDFHPESQMHNYDEVRKLSKVARNAEGRVIDALHRTNPFLTKYEYTRVLGQRAKQIDAGAVAFVKTPPEILDGYLIAKAELEAKKLPFIIRRPLPGGGFEYWHLEDLELLR